MGSHLPAADAMASGGRSRVSRLFAAALVGSAMALAAARGVPAAAAPGSAAGEPLPTIAARTAGLARRPGLLATYVDPQRGRIWLEVPPPSGPAGEVASYLYSEWIATGLGSNPVGLDRGQLGEARIADPPPPRRPGARRASQPQVPRPDEGRRRAARGARLVRHLRSSGPGSRRRRPGRPGARRLHPLPDARRPRHRRDVARGRPGELVARRRAQRGRSRELPRLPREPRARGAPDLPVRRPRGAGARDGAGRGGDHPRAAPVAAAPARTTATSRAGGDPRAGFFGVEFFDYAAPIGSRSRPLPRPPPPGEGRSHRGALAGQEADRLLPRSRRARADPQRPARGRELVEARRSTRPASSTPSRSRCCRRAPTRSTSRYNVVAMGAPLDPRLVLRRRRHRSAHRRDPQGASSPWARSACARTA